MNCQQIGGWGVGLQLCSRALAPTDVGTTSPRVPVPVALTLASRHPSNPGSKAWPSICMTLVCNACAAKWYQNGQSGKHSFRLPVPVARDGEAPMVGSALLLILLVNFLRFHHSFPEPSVPLIWQKQSMKQLRRGTKHFSGKRLEV